MEVTESDFGSTRELGVGDELMLRLTENPTTGYRWQVTCTGDGNLEMVDEGFEAGSAGLPGAAGQRTLRYVARKAGQVEVLAAHERAWDAGKETPKRLTVVVR